MRTDGLCQSILSKHFLEVKLPALKGGAYGALTGQGVPCGLRGLLEVRSFLDKALFFP